MEDISQTAHRLQDMNVLVYREATTPPGFFSELGAVIHNGSLLKQTYLIFRVAIFFCFALAFGETYAQLAMKQTGWTCLSNPTGESKISLRFSDDTLYAQAGGQPAINLLFKQNQDTILFFSLTGSMSCPGDTGIYQLVYAHSGQFVFFKPVKDNCIQRKNLLHTVRPFDFIPPEGTARRDWLQLDPVTDSVAGISLGKAYKLLKGRKSKTVIVAVIDNGVDILHEDLKNVIWTNKKEIPGNGIDDDHNGYTDDVHGWNFRGSKDGRTIENEQAAATQFYLAWKHKYDDADSGRLDPEDKKQFAIFLKAKKEYLGKLNSKDSVDTQYAYNIHYSSASLIANDSENSSDAHYGSPYFTLSPNLTHGTHVAGIIAAERNNQKGIDGVADNVLIMPIVATTATGDERDKDIANAIRYAVDNGARVISMSFSKWYSANKKMVDQAIRYAEKKDVLIVHCAGNDGVDIDSAVNFHYPVNTDEAGNRAGNFITVGWNRPLFNLRLAHPYADFGKSNVDLFAPGSDIFSTVPGNGYDFKSGSSMSTPVVSGVAALLFSYFPSLTAKQVKEILLKSVFRPRQLVNRPQTKMQVPFSDLSASGGIVNAYNAVRLAIEWTKKK